MRVQCVFRHGDRIPEQLLALGNTPDSRFNVTHGHEYMVFGISLWRGVVHYLLLNDETKRPDWFPAQLFQVTDARLPSTWFYAYWTNSSDNGLTAVWGYYELTENRKHYVDLIERESEAMRVFERRRQEVEAENGDVLH
jgi:hypothetical protein